MANVLDAGRVATVTTLLGEGKSIRHVADLTGVSRDAVSRIAKELDAGQAVRMKPTATGKRGRLLNEKIREVVSVGVSLEGVRLERVAYTPKRGVSHEEVLRNLMDRHATETARDMPMTTENGRRMFSSRRKE